MVVFETFVINVITTHSKRKIAMNKDKINLYLLFLINFFLAISNGFNVVEVDDS